MEKQVKDFCETIEKNCCKQFEKDKEFLQERFKDEKEFLNYILECCNQFYYLKNTHLKIFKNLEHIEKWARELGLYISFDDNLIDINYGHLGITIVEKNNELILYSNCEIYDDIIIGLMYKNFNMETFDFND